MITLLNKTEGEQMRVKQEIKCEACAKSVFKWRNFQATTLWGRRWHLPAGWVVTLPHGWLCPNCK